MRRSISAQSLASVPPSRALMRQDGVVVVVRATQQRLELQLVKLGLRGVEVLPQLRDEALVFVPHFDKGLDLFLGADELVEGLDQRVEPLELLHYGLGFLLIVPKIGG